MRYLKILSVVAFAAFVNVACDSSGDGDALTDLEMFEGSWAVAGASDDTGDVSVTFAMNFNSITALFRADGTVDVTVDAIDDAGDLALSGTYSVNELTKTLTVSITGFSVPLVLSYEFMGANEFDASAAAAIINVAFGTTLDGTAVITFQKG